jgi:hypothetical protein
MEKIKKRKIKYFEHIILSRQFHASYKQFFFKASNEKKNIESSN